MRSHQHGLGAAPGAAHGVRDCLYAGMDASCLGAAWGAGLRRGRLCAAHVMP